YEAVFLVALIESLLVLSRWNITDRLKKALVIEPPDPFERGELDVFESSPRPPLADHFRFVEANHRFGEGIVVRVASAADGRLDAGFRQPLGVANGEILHAAVAVMNELLSLGFVAVPERLLKRV